MPNNQYIDYIEFNLPIKLDFWSKFEKKSSTKVYKSVLNTPRVTINCDVIIYTVLEAAIYQ